MLKKVILLPLVLLVFGLQYSCSNDVHAVEPKVVDAKKNIAEVIVKEEYTNFSAKTIVDVDDFFTYRNKIGRFNGVVLFASGNKVFEKAYGYKNFRNKDSLTTNTSFQLASVSKPVTAIGALLLVEKGKLSLKDSVHNILPQFPYKGITVEQLLSHRSGLGNYIYWTEKYWTNQDSLMTNDDVIRLMSENVPSIYYPPNNRYFYNNTNYSILASIISKVSGLKFEDYMQKNIFDPLEMDETFLYSRDNFKNFEPAIGHKNRKRPYRHFYLDGVHGDKGLYSSVGDLLKLDRALRNGILLSDTTKINAYTNRSKNFRKPYGLGWRLDDYNGSRVIYHHGWWRGFKTFFVRSIDDDKTIVVLSNVINGSKLNNKMLLDLFHEETKENINIAKSTEGKDKSRL